MESLNRMIWKVFKKTRKIYTFTHIKTEDITEKKIYKANNKNSEIQIHLI